jgi:hypothetical protein
MSERAHDVPLGSPWRRAPFRDSAAGREGEGDVRRDEGIDPLPAPLVPGPKQRTQRRPPAGADGPRLDLTSVAIPGEGVAAPASFDELTGADEEPLVVSTVELCGFGSHLRASVTGRRPRHHRAVERRWERPAPHPRGCRPVDAPVRAALRPHRLSRHPLGARRLRRGAVKRRDGGRGESGPRGPPRLEWLAIPAAPRNRRP